MAETDAPGVEAYRLQLKTLLQGKQAKGMPHELIISKLDKGAELLNILLLSSHQ